MTLEFRLMKGDVLLGELFDMEADQPWFTCDFVPTPEFETVRALFEADNFEELLSQGVRLADADTGQNCPNAFGHPLPRSLIIDGNSARFGLV